MKLRFWPFLKTGWEQGSEGGKVWWAEYRVGHNVWFISGCESRSEALEELGKVVRGEE